MTFNIGDKVFYGSQGPSRIGAIIKKIVSGDPVRFYPIASLDNSGSAVLIPLNKVSGLAMRHLLAKSEIPALLAHLNDSVPASRGWKQRVLDNAKLFASGSAFDLAQIVQSLTQLGETKELSLRDRQTLEKARRFLICEISEVLEESRDTAKRQVDRALARRKPAHRGDEACAKLSIGRHNATATTENQCTRGT